MSKAAPAAPKGAMIYDGDSPIVDEGEGNILDLLGSLASELDNPAFLKWLEEACVLPAETRTKIKVAIVQLSAAQASFYAQASIEDGCTPDLPFVPSQEAMGACREAHQAIDKGLEQAIALSIARDQAALKVVEGQAVIDNGSVFMVAKPHAA